jgi:hypothetical protein
MKYIKRINELGHNFDFNSSLEDQIIDYVIDITFSFSVDYGDIDDCPFAKELAILHQRKYIDEIYSNLKSDSYYNISKFKQIDFIREYNRLIKQSENIILNLIKKDPSLYFKWRPNLKNVPEWLKNVDKYNL